MISMYAPDSPYTIYDTEEWWKDNWDPLQYGQDFDFSRSFFEQFAELQLKVPRMALIGVNNENSSFTNYTLRNKDTYLIYTADYNEKCYYMRFSDRNYNCFDSDFTYDSRFCLGLFHGENCETCFYSQKIKGCSGLYFCYNMQGCHDCMFSANLQNQQYVIFNKKVSKEDYEKMKINMGLNTRAGMERVRKYFEEHIRKFPRKNLENTKCEDSIGDYLVSCKDSHECYNCEGLRDVKFATHLHQTTDAYDWDFIGYKWRDKDMESAYQWPQVQLSENIEDADESLCDKVLKCAGSSDFYKIIPQELKFYKKFGIALPRLSPMERHRERMKLRNPRKLWDRACAKSGVAVKSSYAPEGPEPVYCEKCYLKEVF